MHGLKNCSKGLATQCLSFLHFFSESLWGDLVGSLESGSIIVCHTKALQTDALDGPSGLLRNKFYSIMDARKVCRIFSLLKALCWINIPMGSIVIK